MSTGIIILAAGNSSRMGKPKQLLVYLGKTLLQGVMETALNTPFRPVTVVLGAFAEQILKLTFPEGITFLINENWQRGMSSSISAGLRSILDREPDIENVIIAVADQVFITAAVFGALVEKREQTGKNIIASAYGETKGTPVLFSKKYFNHLLALEGDQGAKMMLKQYPEDLGMIQFERGDVDVDREEDYLRLIMKIK